MVHFFLTNIKANEMEEKKKMEKRRNRKKRKKLLYKV
jgi:hypothetical protein